MMTEQVPEIQEKPIQPEMVSEIPQNKNFFKTVLLVVLGLIVVAGAVYAGIQIGKKQVAPPELIPIDNGPVEIELSPTQKVTISETEDWKTYINTKYRFSIKYPVNWQVEENVNYIGPSSSNYTFFFKEKAEFMPGVSVYVVPKTTPEKWLGEDLAHGVKKQVIVGGTRGIQGIEVINAPGVAAQEWVFLDKGDRTIIFYASEGSNKELTVFNLMLSTFKFLD